MIFWILIYDTACMLLLFCWLLVGLAIACTCTTGSSYELAREKACVRKEHVRCSLLILDSEAAALVFWGIACKIVKIAT